MAWATRFMAALAFLAVGLVFAPDALLSSSPSLAAAAKLAHLLCSALAFDLSNLLVFTPMTIEMMKKRHKLERELSIGEEVGWSRNAEVAKTNPSLAAMNKKFGMIHGFSSLANIMSFGCLAMHSWYLAAQIQL